MIDNSKIEQIHDNLKEIFEDLITEKIPHFEVLKEEYLPKGLKPHTRSICWLAEQVILQNTEKYSQEFGITNFKDPESDISAWDAKFQLEEIIPSRDIFLNVKITNASKAAQKNDIASVKKLFNFYNRHEAPLLFYVVFPFEFEGRSVIFQGETIIRYYPWMKDPYVNPRNEHIQVKYRVPIEKRSIEEFLKIIQHKAKEKEVTIP